ncbi:hypothetical protein ALC57_05590 [Trachymyrmex cornetzi]|uniref:Uncharacterized protein n=1 Tax=Trachymyrmex cornetzi TaxID=471704 RepID=A0A151JAR5_9HYME|nr:hypothetical protein ALC57_05590 [Trachymyrmex cornetzi]
MQGEGRDSVIDYILIDEEMREEILYMKIEDEIDSNHHPLIVSLKADRDRRRGEGSVGKGACKGVWDDGGREVFGEMLGRMEWREGNGQEGRKKVEGKIREVLGNIEKDRGEKKQNVNESLNALIWKMAPKETYSGFIIAEIATYIATFNEGSMSLLTILETLNCTIGNAAYYMCQEVDAQRILTGEYQAQARESRIRRRQSRLQSEEGHTSKEGQLYGIGIAD